MSPKLQDKSTARKFSNIIVMKKCLKWTKTIYCLRTSRLFEPALLSEPISQSRHVLTSSNEKFKTFSLQSGNVGGLKTTIISQNAFRSI